MCTFVGCRGLLVFSLVVACCWAVQGIPYSESSSSSSLSSSSAADSVVSELPCMHSGHLVLHGERLKLTDCSFCVCDNSTLTCQFRSCPPLTCRNRITLEGICCKVCPYNVTVNEVVPLVHPHTSMEQGQENQIDMSLEVKYAFNSEATSAFGQGLWTLRLWMSSNEDGTNELSGTVMEEALTERQQSQTLWKTPARSFGFEDIRYRFDLTDHTCKEAKFICAKFNQGPNPEMKDDYRPFFFSSWPSEDVLTSCVENHYCEATTPVNEDDDVDVDGGRNDIATPPTDSSLLPSILGTERVHLQEEEEHPELEREQLAETETTPVHEDDYVDVDDGINDIPMPSTGSSLQSLLLSILETERAQLQVEKERLNLEREHLAETREIYNKIVDIRSFVRNQV